MGSHGRSIAKTSPDITGHFEPVSVQLDLKYGAKYRTEEVWAEIRGVADEEVAAMGVKEIAFALDDKPSEICRAVHETDNREIRGRLLTHLILHGPTDRIVKIYSNARGFDLVRRNPLTDRERADRLSRVLDETLGAEVASLLKKKAGVP